MYSVSSAIRMHIMSRSESVMMVLLYPNPGLFKREIVNTSSFETCPKLCKDKIDAVIKCKKYWLWKFCN